MICTVLNFLTPCECCLCFFDDPAPCSKDVSELRVDMTLVSSTRATPLLTWWCAANGCGATERGVATVLWVGPVDGNMGCVSYSRVDWILLMGGVGGAEDRELLEASVRARYMTIHVHTVGSLEMVVT